jgi:hypothetical protein
MACTGIAPIASYFGKLLEILVKLTKVFGCEPSFQARLEYKQD